MTPSQFANRFVICATILILGACAQGTGLETNTKSMNAQSQTTAQNGAQPPLPEKAFNRFPDIPVPSGASMDVKRTIVFGSGETWFGQLGLDTNHDTDTMFDFYKQELAGFGWDEITSVRALVSVLTYERQGRVLSIQLEKATIIGAKITLTVSPRGGAAPTMN